MVIRWPVSICFWVHAVGESGSQGVKPGTAHRVPRVVLSPGCTPSCSQTLASDVSCTPVLRWSQAVAARRTAPEPVSGQCSAWHSFSSTREWMCCPEAKVGAEGALCFHSWTEALVPALRFDAGQVTSVSSTDRWE